MLERKNFSHYLIVKILKYACISVGKDVSLRARGLIISLKLCIIFLMPQFLSEECRMMPFLRIILLRNRTAMEVASQVSWVLSPYYKIFLGALWNTWSRRQVSKSQSQITNAGKGTTYTVIMGASIREGTINFELDHF